MDNLVKGVQNYELFGVMAHENHAFLGGTKYNS